MFSFSGDKSNFFSGIASAASTISFSTIEISRSRAEAMVGGVEGVPDAPAAGELLAACEYAGIAARDNAAVSSRKAWSCFMGLLFFLCLSFVRQATLQEANHHTEIESHLNGELRKESSQEGRKAGNKRHRSLTSQKSSRLIA